MMMSLGKIGKMKKRMRKMNGKIIPLNNKFGKLFNKQMDFQKKVEDIPIFHLPSDDPKRFQYHVTALQEEIGEVLKADKRWKTHRNSDFDPANKLDELADCYLTLMNISIWSGFSQATILNAIERKIDENFKRLDREE